MAKKQDEAQDAEAVSGSSKKNSRPVSTATPSTSMSEPKVAKQSQPSTPPLMICRNKHWRYISSFHGPWLQLPPEVLEALANNNWNLPRPRPIDPAIFFDLLKIRRLVDDAASLAVRATSGVTSSALTNSLNASSSLLGNRGMALGLGLGGGGSNAKLSRERKHRMREQATQKLSTAYHLDEIACSIATMQSVSTLEDVAHLVLQRSPLDPDAKYVHFFHEKIPSRQLVECTSLEPLDKIIAERPHEGEIYRTRAVTKIFKEDFFGAIQDLTIALQECRYIQSKHKAGRQQLQLASEGAAESQRGRRRKEEFRLDEEDHPSSLETQLLFHRANVHLTIACQHVNAALPPKSATGGVNSKKEESVDPNAEPSPTKPPEIGPAEKEAERRCLENRKIVKTHAKKGLRDYIAYLSQLDYTPGLPVVIAKEFIDNVNHAAHGFKIPRPQNTSRALDLESNSSLSNGQLSDALVPHMGSYRNRKPNTSRMDLQSFPSPAVHQISTLFSATPPADLPPYPETHTTLNAKQQRFAAQNEVANALLAQTDLHEALTYHPLLTDALHSLLLCHCLVQTSSRELQRHAYMVARLARVCDGYPIFQAARSPSRADWVEVVRRSSNLIQLSASWETLCAPAPLPGQAPSNPQKETAAEKKDRLKQQAIMEALEDDRVHDETSFQAAIAVRQRQQEEEARRAEGRELPKRWAQEDGTEYPFSTERAQVIVRWIREAPASNERSGPRKKKRSAKTNVKGKGRAETNDGVEDEMAGLQVTEETNFDLVEEEVD
ncbi:hypothetical protein BJ875DRAFT_475384 [Amylocarpus encephaloides]|uniref:Uncharacterized protein n=1 Tax=Amylocarpus encephaloides TaxID=45428 RepID=A0A9P7Y9I7_9HELO|nr:hypothetical protein BJ875DRAFT_475384 [Amylocarpus encephaloides]